MCRNVETITRAQMPVVTLMGVYELNGNILRADLKESTIQLFRRDSNGSFQAFGAVIEKECCPKS